MALEGLEELIKGLEDQESWQVQKQFRLVLLHWPKAVGFAVARVTRPVGIQRGSLYVATSTAAWAQTLAYERLNILRKLNRHQRLPLKAIRFSTAQWNQTQQTQTQQTQEVPQNAPQALGRLAHHPSYIGHVPHLPQSPVQTSDRAAQPNSAAQSTPQETFQRWANAMQQMQVTQALCPRCRCHCPEGELKRWRVCALCATKQWSSVDGGKS